MTTGSHQKFQARVIRRGSAWNSFIYNCLTCFIVLFGCLFVYNWWVSIAKKFSFLLFFYWVGIDGEGRDGEGGDGEGRDGEKRDGEGRDGEGKEG